MTSRVAACELRSTPRTSFTDLGAAVAAARETHELAPSAAFPAVPGRLVVARPDWDVLPGWTFEEGGCRPPAAWLYHYDGETWVTLAVTGDEFWIFAPQGRRRPDLAAYDPDGQPVAYCRRPFRLAQRLDIAGHELCLRPPFDPFRLVWRLRDGNGRLARISYSASRRHSYMASIEFRWSRTPPLPALVSLFAAYSLCIEYGTQVHLFVSGSGG